MHLHHFAQDDHAPCVADGFGHLAFHRAGAFRDPAAVDLRRGGHCQTRGGNLVHVGFIADAANGHRLGQGHVHHVHTERSARVDVGNGVLDGAVGARLDAQDQDRRILREHVEKAHRGRIRHPVCRQRRDQRDGARGDKVGQQPIAVLFGKCCKIKFHRVYSAAMRAQDGNRPSSAA